MVKTIRQLQKEQTRQTLIQTAYETFSRQGILNTRMSDIAVAANVSHGTVFAHFKTQETLIAAVIEDYGRQIALRTHALSEHCRDMREILRAHLTVLTEFEPFYTRLVLENRLLPPEARDTLVSIQSAVSFHFSMVLERDASVNRSLPPHFLFHTWMGLIQYYLANGDLFAPGKSVLNRYGDELISGFLALTRRPMQEQTNDTQGETPTPAQDRKTNGKEESQ